jgi:hypothetical protein
MRKGYNGSGFCRVGLNVVSVCQGRQDAAGTACQTYNNRLAVSGKERLTMLSELELRSIIEGSFLPKRCECTKAEDASLTIKVYDDRDRDRVDWKSKA